MHVHARCICNLTIIVMMLIIGTSSFLNTVRSESSWHFRLLTNVDDLSNLNHHHDQSLSTYLNFTPSSTHSIAGGNVSGAANSNNKVIMLGFDDGLKGQITFAKPILDKYGFKASFFVVCDYVNSGGIRRMNWQDIAELQKDGMDIESHTMTHTDLNGLKQDRLDYEVGDSKQCLASHGYNSTIFAVVISSIQFRVK
jgi:peptidoglycan/xylan/chitin deacetylase (PgdA/CDA1 family)